MTTKISNISYLFILKYSETLGSLKPLANELSEFAIATNKKILKTFQESSLPLIEEDYEVLSRLRPRIVFSDHVEKAKGTIISGLRAQGAESIFLSKRREDLKSYIDAFLPINETFIQEIKKINFRLLHNISRYDRILTFLCAPNQCESYRNTFSRFCDELEVLVFYYRVVIVIHSESSSSFEEEKLKRLGFETLIVLKGGDGSVKGTAEHVIDANVLNLSQLQETLGQIV